MVIDLANFDAIEMLCVVDNARLCNCNYLHLFHAHDQDGTVEGLTLNIQN
jgi:hypothetical protein